MMNVKITCSDQLPTFERVEDTPLHAGYLYACQDLSLFPGGRGMYIGKNNNVEVYHFLNLINMEKVSINGDEKILPLGQKVTELVFAKTVYL